MKYDDILSEALDRPITREEALLLFQESQKPVKYLRLFQTASIVREKECGKLFRLDGWMGNNSRCKVDPPCRYCRRAIPGQEMEKWEFGEDRVRKIAQAFKMTGTTTVEIGGGTDPDEAGSNVLKILKILREESLNVWVNVGPALDEGHIQEMKNLQVEAITSSFETMNPRVFQEIKPGDSLEKRIALANLIDQNAVPLISVLMVGLGESYQDRVDHLFYLNDLKHFYQLAVSWLRIFSGSPLESRIVPPTPIEAARTVAIARLIIRDKYINVSDPQQIQLWTMAGANRMVHAGASYHKRGGFSIGGNWVHPGIEHIDLGEGFEISSLLPITSRYIENAGMSVEPSIKDATDAFWRMKMTS
ncbi:FO synthase subunit 1 [uncultured archaeon]|nr:FO synthase subunit 1 [uncultured archaeon]